MMTDDDRYGPAMRAETQEEADRVFEVLVAEVLAEEPAFTRKKAEDVVRHNLGYQAGYYSDETRERVERLFRCAHPFFGPIAEVGRPSTEDCIKIGTELGQKARERKEREG
jgi:hypothetical protein